MKHFVLSLKYNSFFKLKSKNRCSTQSPFQLGLRRDDESAWKGEDQALARHSLFERRR